jgi:hypothetical protein
MDLAKIVRKDDDGLEAWVEFIRGFRVRLKFISRAAFLSLTAKHRKISWNQQTRSREEDVDTDGVNTEFIQKYVLDWEGLTPAILLDMMPVADPSALDEIEVIDFTTNNAKLLMSECADFERFVTESAMDVSNFQSIHKEELAGNSKSTPSGS